ncbi:glucose-1-phosphate thymidylyltransferase [Actinoplanes sp. NPDC004185]
MKALVLAGGYGTRLRPISHTMAKQLVPIANKPVLFYGLEAIRDAGITDVAVVVRSGHDIEEAVGDGAEFGLRVRYLRQEQPLGLAHTVRIAAGFLGDDDFLMYLGDNVVQSGVTAMVREFEATRPATLLLVGSVDRPQEYGIAEVDDAGRVIRVVEKPLEPAGNLALVGVYLFSREVHEAVRAIQPGRRGELDIADAVQWMIDRGHTVRAARVEGFWRDTGQVDDLLACNRSVLDTLETAIHGKVDDESRLRGSVVLATGAQLVRSVVDGPAVIGPDTVVVDSHLGPYTCVGADCLLENTGVRDSIVLEGASMRGVREVSGSLIGRRARVDGSPTGTHRLVVGDHSAVSVAASPELP